MQLMLNFTAVSLLLHTVPAIIEAFITSREELLQSMLVFVRVLCGQPSFQNVFQLAIIFKFSTREEKNVLS